jgi:hypothetical protein
MGSATPFIKAPNTNATATAGNTIATTAANLLDLPITT